MLRALGFFVGVLLTIYVFNKMTPQQQEQLSGVATTVVEGGADIAEGLGEAAGPLVAAAADELSQPADQPTETGDHGAVVEEGAADVGGSVDTPLGQVVNQSDDVQLLAFVVSKVLSNTLQANLMRDYLRENSLFAGNPVAVYNSERGPEVYIEVESEPEAIIVVNQLMNSKYAPWTLTRPLPLDRG